MSEEDAVVATQPMMDDGGTVLHRKAVRARATRTKGPLTLIPICLICGSDDALVYSEYSEQTVLPDGHVKPARTRYCCTHCGRGRDHTVPVGWRPPGWFLCT